jgi:hypothetical protein
MYTNSIKLLSRMHHCARFLRAIGALYEAFSIHNKAALYETKTTNEAIELVAIAKLPLKSMNMKYVLNVTSLVH